MIRVGNDVIGKVAKTKDANGNQKTGIVSEISNINNKRKLHVNWTDNTAGIYERKQLARIVANADQLQGVHGGVAPPVAPAANQGNAEDPDSSEDDENDGNDSESDEEV